MPNFAVCSVRPRSEFQEDTFRQIRRRADNRPILLLTGRLKGGANTALREFRYPKENWSASEARAHCQRNQGKGFSDATDRALEELLEREFEPEEATVELPALYRAATVKPETADDDERRIDVMWSTGAIVRRGGMFGVPEFDEELSMRTGHVDLARLNNGAPLLKAHDGRRLESVIGVLERAWVEGEREGWATVRFSKRDDVAPVWADVLSGVIRHISVGYEINEVERIERQGGVPLLRAVRWTPFELSAVPIPAENGAGFRAAAEGGERHPCHVLYRAAPGWSSAGDPITDDSSEESPQMADQPQTAAAAGAAETTTAEHRQHEEHRQVTTEDRVPGRDEGGQNGDRAAQPQPQPQPQPNGGEQHRQQPNGDAGRATEPPAPGPSLEERIAEAERRGLERAAGIYDAANRLRVPTQEAVNLIGSGVSLAEAQRRLIEIAAARDIATQTHGHHAMSVVGGDDELQKRARGMVDTLLHRSDPQRFKLGDGNREWVGMTLREMAREFLESVGVPTKGLSAGRIAEIALLPHHQRAQRLAPGTRMSRDLGGLHSTSDFPYLLADVAHNSLRAGYEAAPQTWRPVSRQANRTDFRMAYSTVMGEAPAFELVNEHGEFKRGTISESREGWRIHTYGKIFGITRQVIVNDQLGAFTRIPQMWGNSAANLESDTVWGIVTSNPTMGDGVALFHANHGNLAATPAVISATSVNVGFTAMATQKGLDGNTVLNLQPSYLVTPVGLRLTAEQLITQITPAQTGNVVPRYIAGLMPVAEPRLDANSATAWYLFADPARIDTIEYGYLEGEEGVQTDTRVGFEVDGVEYRARLDFGAKAIDHRGVFKNAGA